MRDGVGVAPPARVCHSIAPLALRPGGWYSKDHQMRWAMSCHRVRNAAAAGLVGA